MSDSRPSIAVVALLLLLVVIESAAAMPPELLKDINFSLASSSPEGFTEVNGITFFSVTRPCCPGFRLLFKTDGTTDGTAAVTGGAPELRNNEQLGVLGGVLIFPGSSVGSGRELWRSDGTAEGTVLIKDINPTGDGIFLTTPFVEMDGFLYFLANDGMHGHELWRTNGIPDGEPGAITEMVKDINPGAADGNPGRATSGSQVENIVNLNGTLIFNADGGLHDGDQIPNNDVGLWRSDGTDAGTEIILDFASTAASRPNNLSVFSGHVYFSANDVDPSGDKGNELWRTDGTAAGTGLFRDIRDGSLDSNPQELTVVGNTLFFRAVGREPGGFDTGSELWKTDGTAAGTVMVKDIDVGTGSSSPNRLADVNGTLSFWADDNATFGRELWKSDGSEAGTTLVKDFTAGSGDSIATAITAFNGNAYFAADDGLGAGQEWWRSDGTLEGTVILADINPGGGAGKPPGFPIATVANGILFFPADDNVHGVEPWKLEADVFGPTVGVGFAPIPIGVFEDGALTATANDENTGGSNIAGIEYQIDGGAWNPMPPLDGAYDSVVETGIQTVSFATEGTHQACARATDVLGNLGEPLCMDIEVVAGDSTPPELVHFDVQPNPVDVGETAVLSVQFSDAATGNSNIVIIEYQVDGGAWTSIIPPADGFYDESVEEGEVDLVFDTVGTHEVCVRAADAANNVSAPDCVDVGAEDPVGLMVKCLHEPLYPQMGDQVVIRAGARDRDGNAVEADRVEIYLNSQSAPFDFADAVEEHSVNYTADGQQFLYGCRAERGDQSAFSRFVSVDVGEPQLSDYPAIPVLYHGPPNEKIDLVFMADVDSYPGGPLDPQFLEDMHLLVSDGLFEIPWFVEHQWVLNIWLATDAADVEPRNPEKGSASLCKKDKPPGYGRRYAFADAVGIIHQEECRDNFIPPGPFTTAFADNRLQVVAHEIGHAVFKLADEYITSPTIRYSASPFPNLLTSFATCQAAALARGKDPDQCRLLPGIAIGGMYIFEPDYNIGPGAVRDLMQQTGAGPCSFDPDSICVRYGVGDSEEARVRWKLGRCVDGKC